MKVYISADIEGITGISHWNETTLNNSEYRAYKDQMTKEVKAAVEALHNAGVDEIYVRDAHDSARNLTLSELPNYVKIIKGWSGAPNDMMALLDESFDACMFIGYHSPSRSGGNPLSHTLSTDLHHIRINGKIASEFLLNAYYAQIHTVPVIFVSGDELLTKSIEEENAEIETYASFSGLGGAVVSNHPDKSLTEINRQVTLAIQKLKKDKHQFFINMPRYFEVEVCYRNHKKAYSSSFYPNASLFSFDKVLFKTDKFYEVARFLHFAI